MTQTSTGAIQNKKSEHPAQRIFRIENHDSALPIWRDSAGTNRILVHVDAHHDMWWVENEKNVTIANFISPAIRDGILSEIYWVVPDRSWESIENRRQILHHLKRIQKGFPGRSESIEIRHDRISTTLLGKPLHICSIDGLSQFREEVLLDLDVDYMLLSRVTYGTGDPHTALPWIWPEELLSRLNERKVRADIITIAYSVYGGFTPLRWKYLGDELEARLAGADPKILHGMQSMREGAEAAALSEFSVAQLKYSEAMEFLPSLAAPLWQLAHSYLDAGRVDEAQQLYRRAVQLDSSYCGAFNSDGLWHFWDRRWEAAEREYRRTLKLDPNDAFAHLGLGWIAQEHSKWSVSESEIHQAQELRPDLLDAHRAMGKIHVEMGRRRDAIASFEKSLKLALTGQESLKECPWIAAERPRLNDGHHFEIFLKLGKLYLTHDELDRASQYMHMGAAGGFDGVQLRCQLVSLAIRQRRWKSAGIELGQACKQSALQSKRKMSKLWRSVRRPFRRALEMWRVR
jgi:tetratricopeptide (TPR) repeat protein